MEIMKSPKFFLFLIILLQLATISFLIYEANNSDLDREPSFQLLEKNGKVELDGITGTGFKALYSNYPQSLYFEDEFGDFITIEEMAERLTKCYDTDNEKIPKEHLKIKVEIDGEKIMVPRFYLNKLDYSKRKGCFKDKAKSKVMENYIPVIHADTLIPFKLKIASPNKEPNEVKFKITFFNSKNIEIAKFPKDGSSHTVELTDVSMVKTIEGLIPIPAIELPKKQAVDDLNDITNPNTK